MILVYQVLSIILLPFIAIYMIIRLFQKKETVQSLSQKFMILSENRYVHQNKHVVWFHAASIGEVNMVIPIIKIIINQRNDIHCLVTTTTLTSAQIFKSRNIANTTHQFLPADIRFLVNKFLIYWKPQVAIFIESEVWPNIIDITTRSIPMLLYNARLSHSSFQKWSQCKSFASNILQKFSLILVASNLDYIRFKAFTRHNLSFIGHFKYSSPSLSYSYKYVQVLKIKLKNRDILVGSSTHKGEEEMLIKACLEAKRSIKNMFIIIIPRDPKRIKEVILIARSYNINYITNMSDYNDSIDLLLVGDFSVLGNYFEVAEIVFVGGSLVNVGGHNIVEPAKQNCVVIVGPYTFNFYEIVDNLYKNNAIIIVQNPEELKERLVNVFSNVNNKNQLIKNIKKVIHKEKNILEVAVNTIYTYLK